MIDSNMSMMVYWNDDDSDEYGMSSVLWPVALSAVSSLNCSQVKSVSFSSRPAAYLFLHILEYFFLFGFVHFSFIEIVFTWNSGITSCLQLINWLESISRGCYLKKYPFFSLSFFCFYFACGNSFICTILNANKENKRNDLNIFVDVSDGLLCVVQGNVSIYFSLWF